MTDPRQPFHVMRGDAAALDPGALAGCVVAIGNFDGVHRGHRAVIGAALARARALGRTAAALTFDPHPRTFFRPDLPVFRLSTERDKLGCSPQTGLDGAVILRFDAALAAHLGAGLHRPHPGRAPRASAARRSASTSTSARSAAGSPAYLAGQGARLGFAVDIVPPLEDEGRPVSSGAVRDALAAGRVVEAAELLGAPWFVAGEVIHGEKRGRELGFPTANLRLDPACGLKHGIYAVRVAVGERRIRRRRELRPPADVRRRRAAARSLPVRFCRRSLRPGASTSPSSAGSAARRSSSRSMRSGAAMAADVAQAREALARSAGAFPQLGAI